MDFSSPEAIAFDPDGDLTLLVGETKAKFLVCSKALSRASPVFKIMLCGPFREGRRANASISKWVVELPEDDKEALRILLDILHGSFDSVPRVVSLPRLHDVLVTSNKYDMTRMIRPWAEEWSTELALYEIRIQANTDLMMIICTSWELGAFHILEIMAGQLCVGCPVNFRGQLLHPISWGVLFGNPSAMPLEPPGLEVIQESIAGIRGKLIRDISEELQSCIATLQESVSVGSRYNLRDGLGSNHSASRRRAFRSYHSAILERTVDMLKQAGCAQLMGPTTNQVTAPVSCSVDYLVGVFRRIEERTRRLSPNGCNPIQSLIAKIEQLIRDRPSPLTNSHKEHLDAQRRKTGLEA